MLTEHEAKGTEGRCVFISPRDDTVKNCYEKLSNIFDKQLGKKVVMLEGNTGADLKAIAKATVVVSTAMNWDIISRRWKQRKNVQRVDLFICDDIHLIGDEVGPTIEQVFYNSVEK